MGNQFIDLIKINILQILLQDFNLYVVFHIIISIPFKGLINIIIENVIIIIVIIVLVVVVIAVVIVSLCES